MKKSTITLILILLCFAGFSQDFNWTAKRITDTEGQNESNSWIDYITEIDLAKVPEKAIANIACDSKYWMWINGNLVVYEGQLKRGPTPNDTYFDKVDIAPFLKKGNNTIAILLWYFGKDGFSHNSSGEMGLAFQCDEIGLVSNGEYSFIANF